MTLPRMDTFDCLSISQQLWLDYLQNKTSKGRNLLFEFYEPWIKNITGNLFSKYGNYKLEWNDFYTLSSWGCLVAIEKFDIDYGVPFEAFAFKYLKGKVLDGIKLSSDNKTNNTTVISQERIESLTAASESEPFDFILDAIVGLALGRFLELGIIEDETKENVNTPYSINTENIEIKYIKQLIEQLNYDERLVIKYHYFQGFKFVEIANLLSITKSRVSQLHKRALANIRKMYEYHIE